MRKRVSVPSHLSLSVATFVWQRSRFAIQGGLQAVLPTSIRNFVIELLEKAAGGPGEATCETLGGFLWKFGGRLGPGAETSGSFLISVVGDGTVVL